MRENLEFFIEIDNRLSATPMYTPTSFHRSKIATISYDSRKLFNRSSALYGDSLYDDRKEEGIDLFAQDPGR